MSIDNVSSIEMTETDFNELYHMLKDEFGIDMSKKKEIMSSRLETYLRQYNIESFAEYCNRLRNDETGKIKIDMVNILSTNHTFFMREIDHFNYLKETILPQLKIKQDSEKDIRIWCGAASTGQEPYCIAMILMDFFGIEHSKWDTKILATDISTEVLTKATQGVYNKEQMSSVPDNWRRRYFKEMENGVCQVTDELKSQVLFRRFNLMMDLPFKRKLHVVFLRNVMIYFDNETRQQLINKIYDVLDEGGYLFIGQTETLDRINVPLKLVTPSIYVKEKK